MHPSLTEWLTGWGRAESICLGEWIVSLWAAGLLYQPG